MMPVEPDPVHICVVCGDGVATPMSAECSWCDGRYHLNQRNDIEAKDCGQVWIDEQFLALQFACNSCLAAESGGTHATAVRTRSRPGKHAGPQRRYKKRA